MDEAVKAITLTEFRSEPGERIRDVQRGGQSFLLTKAGKPAAKLVPVEEDTVITSDGRIHGPRPLTHKLPLGTNY